jgi:hypothetical protein
MPGGVLISQATKNTTAISAGKRIEGRRGLGIGVFSAGKLLI